MLDVACEARLHGARVQLLLARPRRFRVQLLLLLLPLLLHSLKTTEVCCTHRNESVHISIFMQPDTILSGSRFVFLGKQTCV